MPNPYHMASAFKAEGGWWFQLDMQPPVGPYRTKKLASLACKDRAALEDAREAEIVLVFNAPVYVVVRRDGEGDVSISKVVVDDENTDFTALVSANINERDVPLTDPDVLEALALVNDDARDWPSWEFGW